MSGLFVRTARLAGGAVLKVTLGYELSSLSKLSDKLTETSAVSVSIAVRMKLLRPSLSGS